MEKVMPMKEAISKFVHSGDTLFLSGTQHGEPSAAIHEIARQRIDHLDVISCLVAMTGLLIAEGLVDKITTGFMMRNEKRSYALTRARKINKFPNIEETSHFGVALALLAVRFKRSCFSRCIAISSWRSLSVLSKTQQNRRGNDCHKLLCCLWNLT